MRDDVTGVELLLLAVADTSPGVWGAGVVGVGVVRDHVTGVGVKCSMFERSGGGLSESVSGAGVRFGELFRAALQGGVRTAWWLLLFVTG